jgi:hypothetical protein
VCLAAVVTACGGRMIRDRDDSSSETAGTTSGGATSANGGTRSTGAAPGGGLAAAGGVVANGGTGTLVMGGTGTGADPVVAVGGSCALQIGEPPPSVPGQPAQNISGYHRIFTCGTEQACSNPGDGAATVPVPSLIVFQIHQSERLEVGTVTIVGTGEPLLDNRIFDAEFSGRSFRIEVHGPLSDVCQQNYSMTLFYDFGSLGSGALALDFEHSSKCAGNTGDCQGFVHTLLGPERVIDNR